MNKSNENRISATNSDIIHKTLALIRLLDVRIKQQYKPALPDDLTSAEMDVMFAVAARSRVRMLDLSNILGKGKQSINYNVGLLEKKGYVERKTDRNNRKIVRVSITQQGIELMNSIDRSIYSQLSPKFDMLSDEEKENLQKSVDYISETLNKML